MAQFELVREIPNLCRNNQMRDVFFLEVECQDPEMYVQDFLGEKATSLSVQQLADGSVTVWARCDGLEQQFLFTPV